MMSSKSLDNRNDIHGLKFQTYLRFGLAGYDDEVSPFLKSKNKGGNAFNTIRKAPVKKLLLYGGMDSLLTHMLGHNQRKEMA